MLKLLGGNIGRKVKNFSWGSDGFPNICSDMQAHIFICKHVINSYSSAYVPWMHMQAHLIFICVCRDSSTRACMYMHVRLSVVYTNTHAYISSY